MLGDAETLVIHYMARHTLNFVHDSVTLEIAVDAHRDLGVSLVSALEAHGLIVEPSYWSVRVRCLS